MIHPATELRYINDTIGYGVFATAAIPEGTIVYVKDSLEIQVSPTDFLMLSEEVRATVEKYSYIDEKGIRIISWDFAKYVNHCCNCNTISTGYGFEIAIRDIEVGEQITDEYGIFNIDREIELSCGGKNCRKLVKAEDFDTYYQEWDQKIQQSIQRLFEVEQPLLSFLDEETRKYLDAYFVHPETYRSVYHLKYKKDLRNNK